MEQTGLYVDVLEVWDPDEMQRVVELAKNEWQALKNGKGRIRKQIREERIKY